MNWQAWLGLTEDSSTTDLLVVVSSHFNQDAQTKTAMSISKTVVSRIQKLIHVRKD